ncbi:unnamed protein product [Caenorhabditis auriculariae]|uniref:diacylglycerol kinase (ATP) n=1 Tax=Caenorhabditis auriculariae TaxID=2777116 RepID=A0A8S1HGG1_9PELO|nr:unnamed protein product [Caenorhabditis auriculariae]
MASTRSLDDSEAWRQSLLRVKAHHADKSTAFDSMLEGTSGNHQWVQVNHPRPTFCNYCREKLSGVPWHGYTCEVCKMKAHKKCMEKITDRCKWTIEASIPHHMQYISPENSIVPHQWVEGNLPMSAKCLVCEKPCGSVLKLQDWRCIWCACCVHSGCLTHLGRACSLGPAALSVVPPLAVRDVNLNATALLREDAFGGDCGGGSPLIVLVNSKSGDNQGQRMIRKFKRLLNPIQVFDIIATGPEFALTFFEQFEAFRVLVCGGDGTVGWVLSAFDKLNLHSKCQLAILPLGTGNDLARVLGWGHAFYDDTQLPQLVRTFERAHTRMLDRWSVLSIEGPQADAVRLHEELIISKVRAVLDAEQPSETINAVSSLCVTVRGLMQDLADAYTRVEEWERQDGRIPQDPISEQCTVLLQKLDRLMRSLQLDPSQLDESGFEPEDEDSCIMEEVLRRDSLVNRANSLKKALRDMISLAERGIDQHYRDSAGTKRERFRKKRSKTTPSALRVSQSNLSSSSACSPQPSPTQKHKLPSFPLEDPQKPQNLLADCARSTNELASSHLTPTSGYGISQSHSSNTGLSPEESAFPMVPTSSGEVRTLTEQPSIGRVQPPTPGATRDQPAKDELLKHLELTTPDRPDVSSSSLEAGQPEGLHECIEIGLKDEKEGIK